MRIISILAVLITGLLFSGLAEAVQTKLVVRARSKDAKFVGTSMGGALVIIKDNETGKVLAQGLTAGGTGNTQKIMVDPLQRGASITDDATAKFETVIDINDPRLITVEVEAPMARKPNTIKSSTQMWLLPGKDITGDGLMVELPGFSVDATVPEEVKLADNKAVIPVEANIVMI